MNALNAADDVLHTHTQARTHLTLQILHGLRLQGLLIKHARHTLPLRTDRPPHLVAKALRRAIGSGRALACSRRQLLATLLGAHALRLRLGHLGGQRRFTRLGDRLEFTQLVGVLALRRVQFVLHLSPSCVGRVRRLRDRRLVPRGRGRRLLLELTLGRAARFVRSHRGLLGGRELFGELGRLLLRRLRTRNLLLLAQLGRRKVFREPAVGVFALVHHRDDRLQLLLHRE